jgi:hypothetical protein
MAKPFETNSPISVGGKPGDIGIIQVVSVTGTVQLEGSVNGGNNWTAIASFTEPQIQAVVLAPAMRVTDGAGSAPTAVVWMES